MAMFGDVIQKLLVFLRRPEAFTKLLLVAARVSPHVHYYALSDFKMFLKSGKVSLFVRNLRGWIVKKDTGVEL